VYLVQGAEIHCFEDPSLPIGLYRDTRPKITEVSLQPGLAAIAFTDGLVHAGSRSGKPMDIRRSIENLIKEQGLSAQTIADSLLSQALTLDQGRPVDDTSVAVLVVSSRVGDEVRRLTVRLPLEPYR
jgi:serine phosphatase RsbU (regulator of sigma subunit)